MVQSSPIMSRFTRIPCSSMVSWHNAPTLPQWNTFRRLKNTLKDQDFFRATKEQKIRYLIEHDVFKPISPSIAPSNHEVQVLKWVLTPGTISKCIKHVHTPLLHFGVMPRPYPCANTKHCSPYYQHGSLNSEELVTRSLSVFSMLLRAISKPNHPNASSSTNHQLNSSTCIGSSSTIFGKLFDGCMVRLRLAVIGITCSSRVSPKKYSNSVKACTTHHSSLIDPSLLRLPCEKLISSQRFPTLSPKKKRKSRKPSPPATRKNRGQT